MTDRTEPTNPAKRQWIVEQVSTVEVGGEIIDPQGGQPLTAVSIRMPVFVAAHLPDALALLSEIANMMTQSSFDESDLAESLTAATSAARR